MSSAIHKIPATASPDPAVSSPLPLLSGLCGLLLLLLSVTVLTVLIDRGRWWILWRRSRGRRRSDWTRRLAAGPAQKRSLERSLSDWEREMRWGEPILQAAAVLAPLIGLLGTVSGLIGVLSQLGPRLELPAGGNLAAYGEVLLTTVAGLLVSLIATAGLLACQGLRDWQIDRLRRELHEEGDQAMEPSP